MSISFFSKCLDVPTRSPLPGGHTRLPRSASQKGMQELQVTNIQHIRWEAEASRGFESWVTCRILLEVSSTSAASQPLPAAGTKGPGEKHP